jgi:hypothetical protein
MRRALSILFLISAPLSAQQPALDATWLNREAGVEMVFRDPNPAVSKLVFTAVGTGELKGSKLIRYSVTDVRLAHSGPYLLMTWDIGTKAPVIAIEGVLVDEKGALRCGDKKGDCPGGFAGSEVVVGLSGMVGQPRRFVLTGNDKKPIAMGEVVPFPAIGTDGQCSIEAVLLLPNAAATLIVGRGFVPGEPVKFASSSPYGESVESNKIASQSGDVVAAVLPFVKGHDEGRTSVTFIGSKCQPNTTFNWGSYHEEQAQPVPGQ